MDKKKKSGSPGNEKPDKENTRKEQPVSSGKRSDEKVKQPSGSQGSKKHGDAEKEKDTAPRGKLNAQDENAAQEETTMKTTGKSKEEEDFIVGTDENTMEPTDKGGGGRKRDAGKSDEVSQGREG